MKLVLVLLSIFLFVGCTEAESTATPKATTAPVLVGPPGPEGPQVDDVRLNQAINAAISARREELRGPQGEPGSVGPVGPMGPQGSQGIQGQQGISRSESVILQPNTIPFDTLTAITVSGYGWQNYRGQTITFSMIYLDQAGTRLQSGGLTTAQSSGELVPTQLGVKAAKGTYILNAYTGSVLVTQQFLYVF